MDDFLGGGDMYDLVRRELRATLVMMAEASYPEPSGRALLVTVGELSQLARRLVSAQVMCGVCRIDHSE